MRAEADVFRLEKYYLDAADVWGNVYIGYWVQLRWGAHSVSGQQHLLHTPAHGVRTRSTIGSTPPPALTATQASWLTAQAHGVWRCDGPPAALGATLLATPAGCAQWDCPLPRAAAHVALPNLTLDGRGYAERVVLTLPIWQLPLQTLHWGRAHSANHTLVWIRLAQADAPPLAQLWLDGVAQPAATIDAAEITTPALTLPLPRTYVLRDGPLTGHLLHPVLSALDFLPAAALALSEHKYCGLATLAIDGRQEQATVLHELVRW